MDTRHSRKRRREERANGNGNPSQPPVVLRNLSSYGRHLYLPALPGFSSLDQLEVSKDFRAGGGDDPDLQELTAAVSSKASRERKRATKPSDRAKAIPNLPSPDEYLGSDWEIKSITPEAIADMEAQAFGLFPTELADDNDGLLPPAKTLSDWFRSAYTATPPTKPSQDEAKPAKSSSSSSSSSRAKGKRWVDSNRLLVSLRLRERLVAAGARREELNSRFLELRNAYVRQLRLIQMEKVSHAKCIAALHKELEDIVGKPIFSDVDKDEANKELKQKHTEQLKLATLQSAILASSVVQLRSRLESDINNNPDKYSWKGPVFAAGDVVRCASGEGVVAWQRQDDGVVGVKFRWPGVGMIQCDELELLSRAEDAVQFVEEKHGTEKIHALRSVSILTGNYNLRGKAKKTRGCGPGYPAMKELVKEEEFDWQQFLVEGESGIAESSKRQRVESSPDDAPRRSRRARESNAGEAKAKDEGEEEEKPDEDMAEKDGDAAPPASPSVNKKEPEGRETANPAQDPDAPMFYGGPTWQSSWSRGPPRGVILATDPLRGAQSLGFVVGVSSRAMQETERRLGLAQPQTAASATLERNDRARRPSRKVPSWTSAAAHVAGNGDGDVLEIDEVKSDSTRQPATTPPRKAAASPDNDDADLKIRIGSELRRSTSMEMFSFSAPSPDPRLRTPGSPSRHLSDHDLLRLGPATPGTSHARTEAQELKAELQRVVFQLRTAEESVKAHRDQLTCMRQRSVSLLEELTKTRARLSRCRSDLSAREITIEDLRDRVTTLQSACNQIALPPGITTATLVAQAAAVAAREEGETGFITTHQPTDEQEREEEEGEDEGADASPTRWSKPLTRSARANLRGNSESDEEDEEHEDEDEDDEEGDEDMSRRSVSRAREDGNEEEEEEEGDEDEARQDSKYYKDSRDGDDDAAGDEDAGDYTSQGENADFAGEQSESERKTSPRRKTSSDGANLFQSMIDAAEEAREEQQSPRKENGSTDTSTNPKTPTKSSDVKQENGDLTGSENEDGEEQSTPRRITMTYEGGSERLMVGAATTRAPNASASIRRSRRLKKRN